jgi:hypothetical protein
MTGLELCHELHADEQLRDVPIILHSSAGNPHAPGVQFVPKSCALEEFEKLVSRLLASTHSQRKTSAPQLEGSRAPPPSNPSGHSTSRSYRFDPDCEAACSTAH